MISFLTSNSLILSSWIKSYSGSEIPPNIYGYNQVDQYKATITGDFYIYMVLFVTLGATEGNGGAIYINGTANLFVESSCFIKCHSKGQGGAIYFDNTNGKSFLKKVCSMNSYSQTSDMHFCMISTNTSDQCTNSMEHSSVANLKSTKNNNIYLRNSNIIILKFGNISKNECTEFPSLGSLPTKNSYISYTSFENNTSNNKRLMYFGNGNIHDINKCNVIGNSGGSLIYVSKLLTISNSCLIENTQKMFSISAFDTIKIINCTIDNTMINGNGKVIVDSNSIPLESFVVNLDNNGCFSMNNDTSISKCGTYKMKGDKCNMLRKRDIYILTLF